MTVYVDNMGMPAKVGGLSGRWSHLTADTEDELHEFAERLGLKREWFQTCRKWCGVPGDPCVHWHYDVVQTKRRQAIKLGALAIDLREMGALLSARRDDLAEPIEHAEWCDQPGAEFLLSDGAFRRLPCRSCLGT